MSAHATVKRLKGNTYAAFLGLVPGEHSSSKNVNRLGISKTGNTHLRCLLIEAAKSICKGIIGHKSKELRSRQNGQPAEIIAYADKANIRLRSKYYRMIRHGKKKNVAVAAVARELACFVWGMMTLSHSALVVNSIRHNIFAIFVTFSQRGLTPICPCPGNIPPDQSPLVPGSPSHPEGTPECGKCGPGGSSALFSASHCSR